MKKRILLLTLALAMIMTGCGGIRGANGPQGTEADKLDDYLASIKEESDKIKETLEKEDLTQADMNVKAQELYELWDDALNDIWGKLKQSLPEEEFSKLLDEQRKWITDKEKSMEEAGKEYEGGSIYALVVNMEAAKITEARVYELYKLLNTN